MLAALANDEEEETAHSKWFNYVGELACIRHAYTYAYVVLNTEKMIVQGGGVR